MRIFVSGVFPHLWLIFRKLPQVSGSIVNKHPALGRAFVTEEGVEHKIQESRTALPGEDIPKGASICGAAVSQVSF